MSAMFATKFQPLWIGGGGLILLPIVLHAVGLTLDNATVVVLLCMAAMGLNLLVGTTGLVSFGHSAWFGLGGYAAAIAHLRWFPHSFVLPLLFAVAFTALLSRWWASSSCAGAACTSRC
jgi:ABC-type branched-subunit amino acid transport system permease subunit